MLVASEAPGQTEREKVDCERRNECNLVRIVPALGRDARRLGFPYARVTNGMERRSNLGRNRTLAM